MNTVKLHTSLGAFDKMHHRVDHCRSKNVTVDKTALLALLMDHSALCAELGQSHILIEPHQPPLHTSLPRRRITRP